jgi:hypothetical protein
MVVEAPVPDKDRDDGGDWQQWGAGESGGGGHILQRRNFSGCWWWWTRQSRTKTGMMAAMTGAAAVLVATSNGCLVSRGSVGWLVFWLVGRSVEQSVGWPISQLVHYTPPRCCRAFRCAAAAADATLPPRWPLPPPSWLLMLCLDEDRNNGGNSVGGNGGGDSRGGLRSATATNTPFPRLAPARQKGHYNAIIVSKTAARQ